MKSDERVSMLAAGGGAVDGGSVARRCAAARDLDLGRFRLQPDQRRLLVDGEAAALGARAFDVLLALVERRERVVDKSELLEIVWPGVVVEENNLQVQISALRKLLGPGAIATVPGRGYRFVLPAGAAPATLAAPPGPAGNLPAGRTSFIGRDRELAECERLIGDARLLTLTGVGGSGKTRLALRIAERQRDAFPDGTWFVDLAPLDADALVAEVVATTLGAQVQAGRTLEASIVATLRGKRALLLLDNCEHLLGPAAALADHLLGALPDLRLLVTSREGLGIDGERLFVVRSLGLPRAGDDRDPEAILRAEAVRLFAARARDVDSEFVLDQAKSRIVADICRRLDGIPLAIELAAARTRVLSLEQVAGLLDDRFRLLTGGSRGTLERHRTLRATVQWSFDHLDGDEQALFSALSVFAGGWTLDSAAGVTGSDALDVLDRMTRLLDKSMIVSEPRVGDEARYRMLETLRHFGMEMLVASGRADALRAALLAYFLGFVRGMEAELKESSPLAAVARLEAEVDNLRAALTWGFQNDPAAAAELALRLEKLWLSPGGYYEEGCRWYAQTLALDGVVSAGQRASALECSALLRFQQGNREDALRLNAEALAIRRNGGEPRLLARVLVRVAGISAYLGRHDAAQPFHEEAHAILTGLDDRDGLGRLENSMGLSAYLRGDLVAARRRFGTALTTFRELGDENQFQVALGNLALVDVAEGKPAPARDRLRQCTVINRERRNLYGIVHDLPTFAATFRLEGDPVTAARLIGAADALLRQIGAALEAIERDIYQRTAAALADEMGTDPFERARREGLAMSWEEAVELACA